MAVSYTHLDVYKRQVVYRPPSEGRSLIVQVTIGCAHNSCTFCNMYKDKKFRVRTMEEIMKDLLEAQAMYGPYVRRVFLADGDEMCIRDSPCPAEARKLSRSARPAASDDSSIRMKHTSVTKAKRKLARSKKITAPIPQKPRTAVARTGARSVTRELENARRPPTRW